MNSFIAKITTSNLLLWPFVTLSLVATTPVFGVDWKLYDSDSYYDTSSVQKGGDIAHVWIKFNEEGGRDGVPIGVPKRINLHYYYINCKSRMFSLQAASATYQDGIKRDAISEFPNAGIFQPIAPDSGMESLRKIVCKSEWRNFNTVKNLFRN